MEGWYELYKTQARVSINMVKFAVKEWKIEQHSHDVHGRKALCQIVLYARRLMKRWQCCACRVVNKTCTAWQGIAKQALVASSTVLGHKKIGGSIPSTAQHSTAQHSTAQHSTAQHSTACSSRSGSTAC